MIKYYLLYTGTLIINQTIANNEYKEVKEKPIKLRGIPININNKIINGQIPSINLTPNNDNL